MELGLQLLLKLNLTQVVLRHVHWNLLLFILGVLLSLFYAFLVLPLLLVVTEVSFTGGYLLVKLVRGIAPLRGEQGVDT